MYTLSLRPKFVTRTLKDAIRKATIPASKDPIINIIFLNNLVTLFKMSYRMIYVDHVGMAAYHIREHTLYKYHDIVLDVFIALFTASLTSLATCSSIPRILAKSDAGAFSSDLSVKQFF